MNISSSMIQRILFAVGGSVLASASLFVIDHTVRQIETDMAFEIGDGYRTGDMLIEAIQFSAAMLNLWL